MKTHDHGMARNWLEEPSAAQTRKNVGKYREGEGGRDHSNLFWSATFHQDHARNQDLPWVAIASMFWFVFVRFWNWSMPDLNTIWFCARFWLHWCLLFSTRACWRYIGHSVVDPGVRIYHESMRPQVPKFTVVYINQIDSGVLYYLIICTSHQQVGEQDFTWSFDHANWWFPVVTPIFEPLLGPVCLLQTVTPTCVASHYIHVGASLLLKSVARFFYCCHCLWVATLPFLVRSFITWVWKDCLCMCEMTHRLQAPVLWDGQCL